MAPINLVDILSALPTSDTWGPPTSTETTLDGVPYAPYSKGDKLGRMADWTTEGKDGRDGRGGRAQYNRSYRDQQVYGAGTSSVFQVQLAEDESSFSVVSNTRDTVKTRFGRGGIRGRGGQRGGRGDARGGRAGFQRVGQGRPGQPGGFQNQYDSRGGRGGARGGRRFGWKDYDKPQRNRDASVNVKNDWKLLEEIDFNRLTKLNLDTDEGEDVDSYGFLHYYDKSYESGANQTVKTTRPVDKASDQRKLKVVERASYNVTTSQDPVIQALSEGEDATIFATDSILATLMCAPRSVYPWDIIVTKQGNKIFFDKRDNAALDMVSVNENAADPPMDASEGSKDTINQPAALAEEATYINHNFANQVTIENDATKVEMAHENPFYNASEETDPPASKAYKYRRFDLSLNDEEPVNLIVRTEVDAVIKNSISGDDQQVIIKALNEFDSKAQGSGGSLDWKTKLFTSRGVLVTTEMKNNSNKLAKWITQALLANADIMKIGFVTRADSRNNDKHNILDVATWKPRDIARMMNLNPSNGWGIVRTIVDMVQREEEDGKFVLVKDPNKSILRLYAVPANSFEEEEGGGIIEEQEEED